MGFSITRRVFRTGDTYAITIPKDIAQEMGLKYGDYIEVEIKGIVNLKK